MSRPESELKPTFHIAKDEVLVPPLKAMPLSLRQHTLEQFDREFRIQESRQFENKVQAENNDKNSEVAECLANAQRLIKEGELQIAQDLFRAVLKTDSCNELAIRGAAECAREQGQHEEAVQILRTLTSKHKSSNNYLLLANQLYEMGYNHDALESYFLALNEASLESRDLFQIYKNIGNIHLRLGDANGAEEFYNKAYTLFPDSDVLLVNYGSLALYVGEYDKALTRFREAVSINDKNDKAWTGLAMIHREYSDSELAWANLEKALDANPYNDSAIRLVAEWAMKDNEIERAIIRLENYLKVHDQDAVISMWYAKFLYYAGRIKAALIEIEKALYLEPGLEGGMEVLSVIRSEINK